MAIQIWNTKHNLLSVLYTSIYKKFFVTAPNML